MRINNLCHTQQSNNYHASFGTTIKVVSPSFFKHVARQMMKKPLAHINEWFIPPYKGYVPNKAYDSYKNVSYYSGYCLGQKNVLTQGIKSCSSGIVVNKGKEASVSFHVLNSFMNKQKIPELSKEFVGDNAILIGSKSICHNYSLANFDKLKSAIEKKNIPLTYMRDSASWWGSDWAYQFGNDTAYLCVYRRVAEFPHSFEHVKSFDELTKVFKKVQISPTDKLEFLTPMQEFIARFKKI